MSGTGVGLRGQGGQRPGPRIEGVRVGAFRLPTDTPEADGTLTWRDTTLVAVELMADGVVGFGYTYTHAAAASVAEGMLAPVVRGRDPMAPTAAWRAMRQVVRNVGRQGVVASAIAAVDAAMWDLKARLLGLPLVTLLGAVHDGLPVYGSGGFETYDLHRLRRQLGAWAEQGLTRVKMKVGRDPSRDADRVAEARDAVGPGVGLMVDANGAYARKQALAMAERFAAHGVCWFEEPVSSDDLVGLRLLRDRGPAGMEIAAGEYGFDLDGLRRLLEAEAVDALQVDGTRVQGITGLLAVAALCQAHHVPLSAHTAPALHLHPCCAMLPMVHLEWFHDHVRIERLWMDGVIEPDGQGRLRPDTSRPGHGLAFRWEAARRYAVDR